MDKAKKLLDKLTEEATELVVNNAPDDDMKAIEEKINRLKRVIEAAQVSEPQQQASLPQSTPFGMPGAGQYLRNGGGNPPGTVFSTPMISSHGLSPKSTPCSNRMWKEQPNKIFNSC